jgi:hypothetical protein
MLPFIRILLLWVTLLFTGHSVLAHYSLGEVSTRTLTAGIESNAFKFYGFLAAFGISAYYFCREIEEWRKPMPAKVFVCAVLAVLFFIAFLGLANMDQNEHREMSDYQENLVAGRLRTKPSELRSYFESAVAKGATREAAEAAYPNTVPQKTQTRRDGTAFENFLYWMGPGVSPVGAQVSYSTPPYTVTGVEALPREMSPPFQSGSSGDEESVTEGEK